MGKRQPQHVGWRTIDALYKRSTTAFDTERASEVKRITCACVNAKLLVTRTTESDQGACHFTCRSARSHVSQKVPCPEWCLSACKARPNIHDVGFRPWLPQ